jgi:hypothetical protein
MIDISDSKLNKPIKEGSLPKKASQGNVLKGKRGLG